MRGKGNEEQGARTIRIAASLRAGRYPAGALAGAAGFGHAAAMHPVFAIAPSSAPDLWMVCDIASGEVVNILGRDMRFLSLEDADDLAELLNHVEGMKRGRRR